MAANSTSVLVAMAESWHALGEGKSSWHEASRQAARLMQADGACILWREKSLRQVVAAEFIDIPEATLQAYNSYYYERDSLARKFSYSPAGTRFLASTKNKVHDAQDREFIHDFMQANRLSEIQGFVLHNDNQYVVSMSFLRESAARPNKAYDQCEKQLLLSVSQAFTAIEHRTKMDLHHISSLLQPDTYCWLIMNERAELLYDASAPFHRLEHGGSLQLYRNQLSHKDSRWTERIRQSLVQAQATATSSLLLVPDDWGRSYRLHIASAPERYSFGLKRLLLVRIECRNLFTVPSAQVLKDFFNLTPAEGQLCHHIVAGVALKDVAQIQGISPETARKHLASILKKTGCSRQSELQRLIASI